MHEYHGLMRMFLKQMHRRIHATLIMIAAPVMQGLTIASKFLIKIAFSSFDV